MDDPNSRAASLRIRWILAIAGWVIWGVSLVMPAEPGFRGNLYRIYPETADFIRHFLNRGLAGYQRAISVFIVIGIFLAMSVTFALSPLLVMANHSLRPGVRTWRWLGWGLAGAIYVVIHIVVIGMDNPCVYLFGIGHLLVAAAIVPWPREPDYATRGFEVTMAQHADPQVSDSSGDPSTEP